MGESFVYINEIPVSGSCFGGSFTKKITSRLFLLAAMVTRPGMILMFCSNFFSFPHAREAFRSFFRFLGKGKQRM